MPISYAVLLDAGFVRRKLGTPRAPIDAAGINAFVEEILALPYLAGMRLHRIYFYDAKPLEGVSQIPLSGGTVDFGASRIAACSKKIHAELVQRPFFALRFGELLHEGWGTIRSREL
jgi:hypothetical protein